MFYNPSDDRRPLQKGDVVSSSDGRNYIIDKHIGSGGFSLMYIAHQEGASRYVALKELFPRHVADRVVERRDDGRIVIRDPLSPDRDCGDDAAWEHAREYFRHEAALTKKASAVFDSAGKRDAQNSPDVLQVSKPFQDKRGNCYITVDTAYGEPLSALIERGFIRDESGRVLTNSNLEDIIRILRDTARLLAKLHGGNHILHLDLSPDNIYITRSSAGTRFSPHIIDYASGYDLDDPGEAADHRFTCNPYSSPEVSVLAELNDQDCGYQVSPASDTYAVVSILFLAVTGQVFSPEMMFRRGWKARLIDEYALELYGASGRALADEFIRFFEKGLSSDPSARFTSASQLFTALSSLKQTFHRSGNLLDKISPDELMSYIVLDTLPLYAYKSASGDLDVLCMGSGVFVKRMILSMLSCGQMIGSHLNIHVVSSEPEPSFRGTLLAAAPELARFSNLAGTEGKYPYASFTYEYREDLLGENVSAEIARACSRCRYVVISLGSNNKNIDLAHLYGRALAGLTRAETCITYYLSEDAANNLRASVDVGELPGYIKLAAFSAHLPSYSKEIRSLARRSLKVSHLYKKLANPRIALAETAQEFSQDPYGQKSSCAAALHLKYKLASVGINPAPANTHKNITAAYLKCLDPAGPVYPALLELEHRRWIMYMAADGYRLPSMEKIDGYSFCEADGHFNGSFKSTDRKWHHCLTPCDPASGIVLEHLPKAEWDQYRTIEEIEASAFDPLDKMSLKVHLLAWQKLRRPSTGERILSLFRTDLLSRLEQREAEMNHGEAGSEERHRLEWLREVYNYTWRAVSDLIETGHYTDEIDQLALLEDAFQELGIEAGASFQRLRDCLQVYIEFARYRDYKRPDADLVENLLWILYSNEEMTLLKLNGQTVSDNITAPLLLEPKNLIYFAKQPDEDIARFLRSHGHRGGLSFVPCQAGTGEAIYRELEDLMARLPRKCVIDITGADEVYVAAASRLLQKRPDAAMICCREDSQQIENVYNFHIAPVYRLHTRISADEVYALYGAHQIPLKNPSRYMLKLNKYAQQIWDFYQRRHDDWEMISAFFSSLGGGTSEFWINGFVIDERTEWKPYTRSVEKYKWNVLELTALFQKLAGSGFLRQLAIDGTSSMRSVTVSFQYPSNAGEYDPVLAQLNTFFGRKLVAGIPLRFKQEIQTDPYVINICSGYQVDIYNKKREDFDDRRLGKRYPYAAIVPVLRELEQMGFLSDLECELTPGKPVQIKFIYSDLAIKDCLAIAGNVLELYVWHAASQTGYFDDCKANFSFKWRENVKNELDIILTKGLTTVVVSCKTAKFNKEHLYEIKYLTERFSLNSKAVIVYSSAQAVGDDGHLTSDTSAVKARARAMDIHLIDMSTMDARQLGETLVEIAKSGPRKLSLA